ncbi:MAG: cupin domain-containing protein [Planctomycetota bacterium]
MDLVNALTAPTMDNPHGVAAARLFDGEHAQVIHLTLQPGEALKLHVTPVDVVFYVLTGTGVVTIGDEEERVEADTCIPSPARVPHRWRNDADRPLRVLVVKTPRPTEATRLL